MTEPIAQAPGEATRENPPVVAPQYGATLPLAQTMIGAMLIRVGADRMLRNTTAPGEERRQWF